MSESTQTNMGQKSLGKRSKAALIVAGTAIIMLAAAAMFQFLKPKEGAAGENYSSDPAGRANTRPAVDRRPLARVNLELVDYDTVAEECMHRYGQEVLESIINRTIIHQACRKAGIEISEAEVNEEVVKIAKKFDLDPGNWFRIIETERHLSRRQYLQDIIWPMLALKRLAGQNIGKPTDEEMQKTFVRDFGERVKCRMIMCDKLQRAMEAKSLVDQDPASFGRVARERSIDPGSKAIDGQIQPIRRFAGNDTLEKEAFKLRENEISGIIDVSTPEAKRYVILLCEGRTTPIVKNIEEPGILEQVKHQLEEEKTQVAVAKVFEDLKKHANIDNFLTSTSVKGVQQASGTSEGRSRVVPADGVRYRNRQAAGRTVDQTDGQ